MDRKQYRTGSTLVMLAEEPWTRSPTGRDVLRLEVSLDGFTAARIADGASNHEPERILTALTEAITDAVEQRDDGANR